MIQDDDQPHPSGEDRFAIYGVNIDGKRKRIAETSEDGIGLCLRTLREEGEITNDTRVGVLDRQTRQWIVNPWARGDTARGDGE